MRVAVMLLVAAIGCGGTDGSPLDGSYRYTVAETYCETKATPFAGTLTLYVGEQDEGGRDLLFGVISVCGHMYDVKGLADGQRLSVRVNLGSGLNLELLATPGALDGFMSGLGLNRGVFHAEKDFLRKGKVLGPAGMNDQPPSWP